MEPTDILRQIARSGKTSASVPGLRITVVYQDARTCACAAELLHRVTQGLGPEAASVGAWSVDKLASSSVFSKAVSWAANADAVIISIHATGPLPVALRHWIDAWLPRRRRDGGALIALIGVSGQTDAQSERAMKYLRDIARQGRMEFVNHEYVRPLLGQNEAGAVV